MNANKTEMVINSIDDEYIQEAYQYMKKRKSFSYKFVKKIGTIAACFAMLIVFSMASLSIAAAAGNVTAYGILYAMHPQIAQKLIPVNVSCEDNGIRMEVEAAHIHGDTAEIYISMQDLMENRIDESIDLFDSYEILTSKDSTGTCSFVDYQEETKTATFLIRIQHMNHEKIEGQKLTFYVSEFLAQKKEIEKELPEIALDNLTMVSDVQTEVEIRGGGNFMEEYGNDNSISGFLWGNEAQSFSPTEGVMVTAWGFIDGRLHIQVHYADILDTDNHGDVYLKDESGNVIKCLENISFWDEANTGSYEEYIFAISPEDELSGFSVWGYFVTCSQLTTGNWQVTFPIENRECELP